MLPDTWLPYVFSAALREDRAWINAFAKNRRTYLLGFPAAAAAVQRWTPEALRDQASARFREDPRRVLPLKGWRETFPEPGETFDPAGTRYTVPPPEPRHIDCRKWGAFGKDQADHAWLKRTMRLYDAVKAVCLLHEAEGLGTIVRPAETGDPKAPGEIALHLAIYSIAGFDGAYFEKHFASNRDRLFRLYAACDLRYAVGGTQAQTFYEMAHGLSATERTCVKVKKFCELEGLDPLGKVYQDLSPRGKNRTERGLTKKATRVGPMEHYSQDCCVEIFDF